ncbi:MAG: choice-of-anchor D domain-containing protein, partial [Bryobacteraceae bacterium]
VLKLSATNPATVTLFPPSFSFGKVGVGHASFTEQVTLTNNTGSAVSVSSISFGGANPGDFATVSGATLPCTTSTNLAAGQSCILYVTFTPTLQDTRTATLMVGLSAGGPVSMPLSGFGAVPEVAFNPSSINFGNQPLNIKITNAVQITNTGGVPLHVSGVQLSGANASDFTTTSSCTSAVAANGGACGVSIAFTPTAAGLRVATMLINDDAAGSPQTISIQGTGVAEVVVTPPNINYQQQIVGVASYPVGMTVENGSGVPIMLTSFIEGGTNPGDFPIDTTISNTPCSAALTIAAGASCTIYARFLPTAAGTRTANVVFSYTGFAGSPQTINLTGVGLSGVSVSSTAVAFGSQYVGYT